MSVEQIFQVQRSFNLKMFTVQYLLETIMQSELFEQNEIFRTVAEISKQHFEASVKLREENETLKRKYAEEVEVNKKLKTTLEKVGRERYRMKHFCQDMLNKLSNSEQNQ